jgi:hypothetical protein
VLQGRLTWAVGGGLDSACVIKNLPTSPQVRAWIEQRFRINFAALGFVTADLHQTKINVNAVGL